jgi:hypothetical protein
MRHPLYLTPYIPLSLNKERGTKGERLFYYGSGDKPAG